MVNDEWWDERYGEPANTKRSSEEKRRKETNKDHLLKSFFHDTYAMAEWYVKNSEDDYGFHYHCGRSYDEEEAIQGEIKWLESEYVEPIQYVPDTTVSIPIPIKDYIEQQKL